MIANDLAQRPHELAHESRFQQLTRVGFAGRGILYILIAWLALETGRTEDLTGALEYLGRGSGRILLMVITAGLAAYGLWRLADAAFGIENPGTHGKPVRKRIAAGFIGCIYVYMAYKAVTILLNGRADASTTQDQADTALHMPGGTIMLGLAALILAIAGLNQLRKAGKCSFLDNLDDRAREPLVKWLGRVGYAARGVIFLTVGLLVGRAAIKGRASEAGGMEEALDFFSGPVLYAVCLGLLLFGLFSLIEALYRKIHRPPPVEGAVDRLAEQIRR